MRQYASPFRLLDGGRCTSPRDAKQYPVMHARYSGGGVRGKKCPVHGSPSSGWRAWSEARECYARTGDRADLQRMLLYVTACCPPDARPRRRPPPRVSLALSAGYWFVAFTLAALAFLVAEAVTLLVLWSLQ